MYTGGEPDDKAFYKWVETGQSGLFSAWKSDQPNYFDGVGLEKCVEMMGEHNYNWNNAPCGMKLPFICEIYL